MLGIIPEKIADLEGERYRTSPHFSEGERVLLDFAVQIGVDANRVPRHLWDRMKMLWSDAQIVDAAFVITTYIAVSKFGDALGVGLESMFDGVTPVLHVAH